MPEWKSFEGPQFFMPNMKYVKHYAFPKFAAAQVRKALGDEGYRCYIAVVQQPTGELRYVPVIRWAPDCSYKAPASARLGFYTI